ncbi:PQ loop repeat-domain-containing protein [Dichotomocladium elegans]|nr:PQ loop repeat-domain-containing protein [Dichotomocladium elegans]
MTTNMLQSCPAVVDGISYIPWIHRLFGECVYGWQECFSLCLGYLSILCWLNAQMPQVIKNYRRQDADSLSFTFLTVWLSGDVANFVGCIYTGQLTFQVYLSIYFIFIDTVLCMQWIYYVKYPNNRIRRWLNPDICIYDDADDLLQENTKERLLPNAVGAEDKMCTNHIARYGSTASSSRTLLFVGLVVTLSRMSPAPAIATPHTLSTAAMTVTTTTTSHDVASWDVIVNNDRLWMGRFFAWMCTCLYLSSRVPQIYLNYARRSVEGLSMALFMCAAAGNFTYTLGVFTNPHQTRQSLLEAVPYILGSAGTLVFDLTIYIQYRIYNRDTQKKNLTSSSSSTKLHPTVIP